MTSKFPGNRVDPTGSVQGICTGAGTLLAILIAFIGFTGFKSSAPWSFTDLCVQIIPSIIATIALAFVPYLATHPVETTDKRSLRYARASYAIGAILVLVAVGGYLVKDYINNHQYGVYILD
jgi:O-antigen/teichoic acid export membrane protein